MVIVQDVVVTIGRDQILDIIPPSLWKWTLLGRLSGTVHIMYLC